MDDLDLNDPEVRVALYRDMHPRPWRGSHDLLRELLLIEMRDRGKRDVDDEERLTWATYLLGALGHPDDLELLWKAKCLGFDASFAVDIQVMVGAGVGETIAYLSACEDDWAKPALEYIESCREAGDFEDLDSWRQWRSAYWAASDDTHEARNHWPHAAHR